MKRLLPLLLLLFALPAGAQSLTFVGNWTTPTLNTDGTTITVPLTYNVYEGVAGAETSVATGLTVNTYNTPSSVLKSGTTICMKVTAVEGGQESVTSNESCKTFPPPTSLAPALTTK